MTRGKAVEHHLEVTRTARYWTLGDAETAREVWFVLHGYKQLAKRFLRRFVGIASPDRLIVAPEALSRFYGSVEPGRHGPSAVVGASWMTREDRVAEIRDYVAYLDRLARHVLQTEAEVHVLGFSQGTATAARWVTHGEVSAKRLILWGGFVPHDLEVVEAAEVFARTELVLVRGDADAGLTPDLVAAEKELLAGTGIEYRTVSYEGGHEIDPLTLRSVAQN